MQSPVVSAPDHPPFASLTKRLVSVPKDELDEARERSKQPN